MRQVAQEMGEGRALCEHGALLKGASAVLFLSALGLEPTFKQPSASQPSHFYTCVMQFVVKKKKAHTGVTQEDQMFPRSLLSILKETFPQKVEG